MTNPIGQEPGFGIHPDPKHSVVDADGSGFLIFEVFNLIVFISSALLLVWRRKALS
ncbi:hypothetical protein BCR33DRAFT_273427 [Rhizoclosmatium globosum]|uniref:Uncharacterized protein n=1 Tax=Rhizoclosmatium globosum TaxID=329046 RepID=A0A1Y2C7Y1_9FUNG|nr:hypothetical protein BCR33DRAFT_273427 [Rhizoclosmatium globosum]|eukprot:ORY43141.1 hypothetical protein BCR33DRAFT_273427 [Rhizoclosmatium globosum]